MKKNYGFIIFIMMAVLMLFASCEQSAPKIEDTVQEEISRDLVDVGMVITENKSLSSEINRDIKYWEFMATPKFTLGEGEKIYGTVSYWRMLTALDTGEDGVVKTETSLGRYTSGDWLFELRALNSNKKVVAIGSTQQIVREGLDNTVHITMLTDRADGTHGESADRYSSETGWDGHTNESKSSTTEATGQLHVGFVVNRVDENIGENMRIVTKYQKIEKSSALNSVQTPSITWDDRNGEVETTTDSTGAVIAGTAGEFYTKWYKESNTSNWRTFSTPADSAVHVEKGKVYYEGILSDLPAGPYIFTFYLQGKDKSGNWIDLGGQAVDVIIIGGEETQVKGTLLANEYVLAGLKITSPGSIYGTINGVNYIKGTPGTPVNLKWQQSPTEKEESGENAERFYWSVNGTQTVETNNDFSFNCPKDEHDQYIYGIYRVSCTPTGVLGSTGNATVDIIFNPTEGPNVGEFIWPTGNN